MKKNILNIVLSALLLIILGTSNALALETPFMSPTGNSANGFGDTWSNASGAYANGGGSATESDGDRHHYYTFNFTIPGGSTIDGIEVKTDTWSTDASGCSFGVDLSWNGGSSWSNQKTTSLNATETTYTFGGASDEWGTHDWTLNDFTNGNFRVRVDSIAPGSCTGTRHLDWIRTKVYYTEPIETEILALQLTSATPTNTTIAELTENFEINLDTHGTNLTIVAETNPMNVGSVRFNLDAGTHQKTENIFPYSIMGDTPAGNFAPMPIELLPLGLHSVTATPYSEADMGGIAGDPFTVNFKVIQNEAGRCDDEVDNDLDELVDSSDPDCPPVPTPTGSIEITKYACTEGTVVTRSANGVSGSVPGTCAPQSGVTFSYVHGESSNNSDDASGELADATAGNEDGIGTTNGSGILTFSGLAATGRYLVYESDENGVQLSSSEIMNLYCEGDGDTGDTTYDNQELTFVAEGDTAQCVAYNVSPIPPQCSDASDNDDDSFTDYNTEGGDPECSAPTDNNEGPDMCTNISGDQASVPDGYYQDGSACFETEGGEAAIIWIYKQTIGLGGVFPFSVSGEGSIDPSDTEFELTTEGSEDSDYEKVYVYPDGYNATFTVAEDLPEGWQLTSISCNTDDDDQYVIDGTSVVLTIDPDSTLTCTFTNTAVAELEIIKQVINDEGGTAAASNFVIDVENNAAHFSTINGSEAGTIVVVAPGTYTITEPTTKGYERSYSEDCTGSITLGERKTCIVTNTDVEDDDNSDSSSGSEANPSGSVLGASIDQGDSNEGGQNGSVLGESCGISLTFEQLISIKNGVGADPEIVKALQEWLNESEGAGLTINGIYDEATKLAIMKFQEKHASDILASWGAIKATGNVWMTTAAAILKAAGCGAVQLPELVPFNS